MTGSQGSAEQGPEPPAGESFLLDGPETSWSAIAATVVLTALSALLVNQVLFAAAWPAALARATHGWVHPTLLGAGVMFGLVVSVGILAAGRLRMRDLYWNRRDALIGAGVTLAVWVTAQLLVVSAELARGHALAWSQTWTGRGVSWVLGALLAQLMGNALVEETVFRGFFFPQLARKLRRIVPGRKRLLLAALLGSQALFSLSHIPNRLAEGMPVSRFGPDLLGVFLVGVVIALIFLATRNLWVVVGLHSLGNRPATLLATSDMTERLVLVVLVLAVAAAWRPVERRFRSGGPHAGTPHATGVAGL